MAEHLTQTVLNIDPQVFWGLVGVGGFGLACVVVFALLGAAKDRQADRLVELKTTLGLKNFNSGVFLITLLLWGAVLLLLLSGQIGVIWDVIWHTRPVSDKDVWDWRFSLVTLTALTATLGAVVALPITLQRLRLTRQQTNLTAEALLNDKINVAAGDLHARRLVTMNPSDKDDRWDFHQDDIIKRNAAIDRLFGLAEESPDIAPRIARMLGVYVRELSAENLPQEVPEEATPEQLRDWAQELKACRSDMENAVQTLGRLQAIDGVDPDKVAIDLRGANLQGFDLQGASLEKARLGGAQMQGAVLWGAQMQGAGLGGAQMQGAGLGGAQMDDTTAFKAAMPQGAALKAVDYTSVDINQAQVDGMFGDGSVILPAELTRPVDWPQEDLEWHEFFGRWRAWQKERGFEGE